jgi:hypothetical protein
MRLAGGSDEAKNLKNLEFLWEEADMPDPILQHREELLPIS